MAAELERVIRLTPFSRKEFQTAWDSSDDPIEQARRVIILAFQGFGTTALRPRRSGFRARTYKRSVSGPQDWATWPDQIKAFTDRLQGVLVECMPALDIIRLHDGPNTLFYVDPPYLPENRSTQGKGYLHEMSIEDHVELLELLKKIKGAAIISSYRNDLYDSMLPEWKRIERPALADHGVLRIECLYFPPHTITRQKRNPDQISLFG